MKPEILVIARIYPPTLAALEREYTVHNLWGAREPESPASTASAEPAEPATAIKVPIAAKVPAAAVKPTAAAAAKK